MSLTEGSASSSASVAAALGDLLLFFGSVADYAAGVTSADSERIASLAFALGGIEQLDDRERSAIYFAARLRNAGALGNPAFGKGDRLPERDRAMALRDVPAEGARLCDRLKALPANTADIVRWQAERWDGTGYPDQLRWGGIPGAAQLLHIASLFVTFAEPEEALLAITAETGRAFAPEQTRSFVMWYHMGSGEITPVAPPYDALDATLTAPDLVLDLLAQACDVHNATPKRSERVASLAVEIVRALSADEGQARAAQIAGRLHAIGELREAYREDERFDPLGRLGLDERGEHAIAASLLVAACTPLAGVAPVVRARGEWFDGSGKPDGLRGTQIPPAAQALSVALTFDSLEEAQRAKITEDRTLPLTRIETSSGTQFDPQVVRALLSVMKARM